MKSYLISDNHDTLVAMQLAGISGEIARGREEILQALHKSMEDPQIGILIITEKVLEQAEREVMNLKLSRRYPLIVEIPDRHGQRREAKYITRYINESVGIKI